MNFREARGISASDMHLPETHLTAALALPPPRARGDAHVMAESVGDPAAFAALFDRHWPALHGFCTSRAGSAGEDIAAETFRLAFDHRRRYDTRYEDARPWLYGIATNLIRNHFRSAQRRERAEGRTRALASRLAGEGPIGELERQLLGPRLTTALGELTPAERDALLLFAWAELDYAEIARALEVPVGTVRSRLHRARRRLQAHLTEGNDDD